MASAISPSSTTANLASILSTPAKATTNSSSATTTSTSATNSSTTSPTISTSTAASTTSSGGKTTMDVNDFLKLLAAQFKYQDPMNPISDTGFIGQMAQMTSLQQMSTLSNTMTATTAVNYIGKEVVITDSTSTNQDKITGTVSAISIASGIPMVTVNGSSYKLADITEVHGSPTTQTLGS